MWTCGVNSCGPVVCPSFARVQRAASWAALGSDVSLSLCLTVTLSHCHCHCPVTLSLCLTVTLSHCLTVTLSHWTGRMPGARDQRAVSGVPGAPHRSYL
eukprot:366379-Chlamydomonas_euryale.AAC.16